MSAFLVQNAVTRAGETVDIEIRDGDIARIANPGTIDTNAFDNADRFNAAGSLVTPTFSEPHTHLDTALTVGEARENESGTLEEGWVVWEEVREQLTKKGVKRRGEKNLRWFVSNGVTRVRTHVDVTAPHWESVEALLELQQELAPLVDLELIAFPINSVTENDNTLDQVEYALEMGVDIVGGLPHREPTREAGVEHVQRLVSLAEAYDRPMDFHIDESDDPQSRYTEVLIRETTRRNISDRVTASHVTAMHSYPNTYARKLIDMLARSDASVVTNPMANAVVQGRYDDYPRRRGHTRIQELRDAGVTVGLGQDAVMDTTYQYGNGDPLSAAFVLMHFAHMNLRSDIPNLWDMLTYGNADVHGVENYGLEPGAEGSLVVFDSPDPFNALRTQLPRQLVLKEGNPIVQKKQTNKVLVDGKEITYNHTY